MTFQLSFLLDGSPVSIAFTDVATALKVMEVLDANLDIRPTEEDHPIMQ